jgi:preprotein translocase subunit YajC
LFLVVLIGSYWFVMVPPGRERQERERQQGETER